MIVFNALFPLPHPVFLLVRPRVFGDQRGLSQDKPVEISVLAGEEATLPCEAKSLPPPIITWAKDSQLISPFSPR